MPYLTSTHQTPPAYVHQGDMLHPTAEAIASNDTARLAELDLWPHVTAEGPAPLGYTDWTLADGVYSRQPAGTPEEIAAALAAQAEAELIARRAAMTCTPRQARLALHEHGILNAVEDFVQAGDSRLYIEWNYATEIKRTWPPVAEFAVANDISDETLDGLFELAATL